MSCHERCREEAKDRQLTVVEYSRCWRVPHKSKIADAFLKSPKARLQSSRLNSFFVLNPQQPTDFRRKAEFSCHACLTFGEELPVVHDHSTIAKIDSQDCRKYDLSMREAVIRNIHQRNFLPRASSPIEISENVVVRDQSELFGERLAHKSRASGNMWW